MKLKFLGASGTVTGSSYLLTNSNDRSILIDMGMFQGTEEISALNKRELGFEPKILSCVILTHAHLDHCGRLPLLIKRGFSAPIFMTKPTYELLELSLLDTVKISREHNNGNEPLYGEKEVEAILALCRFVEYDTPFRVKDYEITYYDAGHILGSASVVVTDMSTKTARTIAFSGDVGNFPQEIVRPTRFIEKADYVVMESTYGGRVHGKEDAEEIIASEINNIEEGGGVLLIPAFSLERTQEVLHYIDHLKSTGKVKGETVVFLDSPMAIKATNIFKEFPQYFNKEMKEHFSSDDPFDFEGLRVVENVHESQAISETARPFVVIAGSGMMTGGRILSHALTFLPDSQTRILFVGYQAEGTLGRRILEGEKDVSIFGQNLKINAHVSETTSLSSHADSPRLIEWLRNIAGVKKVFLTHGENEARDALKKEIAEKVLLRDVNLPSLDEEFELK